MFKPIPRENNDHSQKTRLQHVKSGEKKLLKLRQKFFQQKIKKDNAVIKTTCIQFIDFLVKKKKTTSDEVSSLIQGLQKTILTLQHQQAKILMAKQKNTKHIKRFPKT